MDKILIFGHKNPDTDSVCGTISLAYLKKQMGFNVEPRILSEINAETAFVLNKADGDKPADSAWMFNDEWIELVDE